MNNHRANGRHLKEQRGVGLPPEPVAGVRRGGPALSAGQGSAVAGRAPPARVVVIVPTRNEVGTIEEVARRVLALQDTLPHHRLELLVIDGLSSDGTVELVTELGNADARVHVRSLPRTGLGVALLAAYAVAAEELQADVIAQLDADLSHEPERLAPMLEALSAGHDLVIGSRFVAGGGTRAWPLARIILCRGANLVIRVLTGCWSVRDWTSGYRAFTVSLYRRLDLGAIAYRDYTLQPALVFEAVRQGASVCETPIVFTERRAGKSKLPVLSYPLNLLRHFALARLRRRARAKAAATRPVPA